MTREELKKIAMRYAHNELKDSQSPIEDVVAAAFLDGIDYAGQHQWISVEDELPPMHCHLQDLGESTYGRGKIFCDSEPVITHRVDGCIDMHCLMFNGEKNEFVWGGWNGSHSHPFDGSMITHWMMPTPPHHIIDANKKVDRVIGTADHIKTALDVLNKKGGRNDTEE